MNKRMLNAEVKKVLNSLFDCSSLLLQILLQGTSYRIEGTNEC